MSLKVGPILAKRGNGYLVEATKVDGAKATVHVPDSLVETTTEGMPQRKFAWAPAWWCDNEGVKAYREPRALFPLAKP